MAAQGFQPGSDGHGLSQAAGQITEGSARATSGGLRSVNSAGPASGCYRGMVWQVSRRQMRICNGLMRLGGAGVYRKNACD